MFSLSVEKKSIHLPEGYSSAKKSLKTALCTSHLNKAMNYMILDLILF